MSDSIMARIGTMACFIGFVGALLLNDLIASGIMIGFMIWIAVDI